MKNRYFNIDFALCHLLREIGFHKESDIYFVKAKGKAPKILPIRKDNYWHLEHYDWNKREKYVREMGTKWKTWNNKDGIPFFSYYDFDSYLCTIPGIEQIKEFANSNNIEIDYTNKGTILISLIKYYRSKSRYNKNGFEGYLHALKSYPIN